MDTAYSAYKERSRVLLLLTQRDRSHRQLSFDRWRRSALACRTLLLDGEVVAFDRSGISRFQLDTKRRREIGLRGL